MTIVEYITVRDALVLKFFLERAGMAESREDFKNLLDTACVNADNGMLTYVRAVTGKNISPKALAERLTAPLVGSQKRAGEN